MSTTLTNALEMSLPILLIGMALICLFDRHLFRACLAFSGFAVMMTYAWWLLDTTWLAWVELILGVLLTSLALFHAIGMFPTGAQLLPRRDSFLYSRRQALLRLLMGLVWLALLFWVLYELAPALFDSLNAAPLTKTGVFIVTSAMVGFSLHAHLLRRLLAFNVLGSGIFLLLAGLTDDQLRAQALISVGLLVAWLGTLMGALLIRRLYAVSGDKALIDNDAGG